MKQIGHIFIDEMKNGSLPNENLCNNNYYVFSAVVISDKNLLPMRDVLTKIIHTHFRGAGVLKSTSISRKNIWIDIANRLKTIPHYCCYLVIDMERIDGDGLRNSKWSFEKYFQNLINKRFLYEFCEVHVTFDRTGNLPFQQSLKAYMARKGFETNLFDGNTFSIKDDKTEEPLLQIADFYAGIVGRFYRNSERDKLIGIEDVYDSIRDRIIPLHFPDNEISISIAHGLSKDEFNEEIFNISIDSAREFLKHNSDKETECEIVSYIFDEALKKPFRFVSSKEISRILRLKYNKAKVNPIITIGSIRDKGTLIVSQKNSNSGGYKLPCNETEIHGFYNSFTLNIIPQLKRIGLMNNTLIRKSEGVTNILKHHEHETLYKLVDLARNTRLRSEK